MKRGHWKLCVPAVGTVVELHGEVDVVASGHSRLAARAHDLASFDHIAFVHSSLAKVAVDRL